MKFYGYGIVMSGDRVLCRFSREGVLETTDAGIIEELITRGYRHDPEPVAAPLFQTETIETPTEKETPVGEPEEKKYHTKKSKK